MSAFEAPGFAGRRGRNGRRAAALLALCVFSGCARTEHRAAKRSLARNFVLLCFDTVRADSFSRRDRPGAAPDAFSAWARRAVVYDDARTAAPWTLPAVASVMTGLYPARHGAGRFAEEVARLDARVPSALPDGAPTLGRAASLAGFDTAAFISNPWVGVGSGVLGGFRRVDSVPTRRVLDSARGWLESRPSNAPFFLYAHWVDAHGSHERRRKRREAKALSAEERRDLIARAPARTCADVSRVPCLRWLSYHREIEIQRHDAAELLDFLRARGLLDDTLVILFSDHGEEFGEHRAEERLRGADPRGYYGAGHGHALYDELLRVPLLVWSPGERPRHDASPVSLVDVAPTARERLGLPVVRGLDGRPLPIGGGSPADRDIFASGIAYGPEQAAVVKAGRKEIAISCPDQTLLFDVRSDAAEKHPAAGPRADPALAAALSRYLAERGPAVVPMRITSARMRALRSLGYLRGSPEGLRRASRRGRREPTAVGVFDPRTATFHLRPPAGPVRVLRFGHPGDLPVVGDWDGDGTTDLGVYRPATDTFYLASRDGGVRSIAAEGPPSTGAIPRAGDWDGDGIDTVALWLPSRKALEWIVANRPGSEWQVLDGEAGGGLPVPGKWRCRGRTALAFFRRSDGSFHFPEPNVAPGDLRLGRPGDLPVAGDWDGDGTVTVGVYRPSTGEFFLRNSLSDGAPDLVVDLGLRGGIPVAGRWGTPPAPAPEKSPGSR
jgi:arylsulfatase A-like enzyme